MTNSRADIISSQSVNGRYDSISTFEALAAVPSVSFAEYLIFERLAAEFHALQTGLPETAPDQLSIDYSPAGQLRVRWRGIPKDRRRTVLVAHVDREGFLVRRVDWERGLAICWHTAGDGPHEQSGSPVTLSVDGKEIVGTLDAIIEHEPTPDEPFDHVAEVQVVSVRDGSARRVPENDYFVGIGRYDLPSWDVTDGVITATSVDNTAGVSVLVTLMSALVRQRWPVNVDCLFTTCEESGFCGIVNEIVEGTTFDDADPNELVCIVVDSSSNVNFVTDADLWAPSFVAGRTNAPHVETSLRCPVVRTGDASGAFDRQVSRLLYTAAANLEGAVERRDWIQLRSGGGVSAALRGTFERPHSDAPRRWPVGRMVGGWCEATPLVFANALRCQRPEEGCRPRSGESAGRLDRDSDGQLSEHVQARVAAGEMPPGCSQGSMSAAW
jgi:putative aminopeptidase FrvX